MNLQFGFGFWEIAIVIVVALIVVALIIGAIFLLVWAFRRPGSAPMAPGSGPAGSGRTALQIAQERYARGEINREDYMQIVSDLQKQG